MTEVHCPSCRGATSWIGDLHDHEWFAGKRHAPPIAGGSLFRCGQCHLKFRSPALTSERHQALYDNAVTTAWSSEPRADGMRIARWLAEAYPDGGRVLDYGCYTGGLLASLPDRFEKAGIEINSAAASVARMHAPSVWSRVAEIPAGTTFDAILLVDVIEHVTDPAALLDALRPLLAPGGAVVITTGDADAPLWRLFRTGWWYCSTPEHVAFVSERWLVHVARERGWRVSAVDRFRYASTSWMRRAKDWPLAIAYGVAPNLYVRMGRAWKTLVARDGAIVARGIGLTKDHLFAVLRPETTRGMAYKPVSRTLT